MFENIAAIDIGSSSVKVVTVKTGIRDFSVKNFIYEDINKEDENADTLLSEALKRIVAENDLKDYRIITNLPMQKTVIRNMTFPFDDREKIAEAIPFEAEDNLPFSLQDIILDFQMLKSKNPGEVLLAAAQKEVISKELSVFKELGLNPVSMGTESQAIFEFYRYFNQIENETVIQLDIGNEKTILNFIASNNLLFTRTISIGMESIYTRISEKYKFPRKETVKIFEEFNIDLSSFENVLQKDFQRENIKKNTLKGIFDNSLEIIYSLIEQVDLTRKAFQNEYPDMAFSRILISGGGSNVTGIGSIISKELELPVVALPFLEEYTETKIRSQFPTAFGTVLSYLNKRYPSISFLRGEFQPISSGLSIKQYYLAAFYFVLAIVVLMINIFVTSYLNSESHEKYKIILNERFKKYFHARQVVEDPVAEATRMLKEEKKEYEGIDSLVHSNDKIINILNDILSLFPRDNSFDLVNLVMNESIIRIDGKIASSIIVDEFKNKLTESKKFDNVTLNTNIKKGNEVVFSMAIKLKVPGKIAEKEK